MLLVIILTTELDIFLKLGYLHGDDDDEKLKEAQRVLDAELLWERQPLWIDELSQFCEDREMLLMEDSNNNCLQARTLSLHSLSTLDGDFSWPLADAEFASVLTDASITQATESRPLKISCLVNYVRVAHFTSEEEPMLNRLRELEENPFQRSGMKHKFTPNTLITGIYHDHRITCPNPFKNKPITLVCVVDPYNQ